VSSAAYDLGFIQAGVDLLEDYLLSKDIYWPLGKNPPHGKPDYPSFTLGSLLLARARAFARALSGQNQDRLSHLEIQLEAIRGKWRVAWGKKAAQEYRARLNLWRDFLEEYRHDPEANGRRYSYEVGRRVMLELLETEADEILVAEKKLSSSLDQYLKAVLLPGNFIWEQDLIAGFPETSYWYLYGELKV
jgi:hypothetical protein